MIKRLNKWLPVLLLVITTFSKSTLQAIEDETIEPLERKHLSFDSEQERLLLIAANSLMRLDFNKFLEQEVTTGFFPHGPLNYRYNRVDLNILALIRTANKLFEKTAIRPEPPSDFKENRDLRVVISQVDDVYSEFRNNLKIFKDLVKEKAKAVIVNKETHSSPADTHNDINVLIDIFKKSLSDYQQGKNLLDAYIITQFLLEQITEFFDRMNDEPTFGQELFEVIDLVDYAFALSDLIEGRKWGQNRPTIIIKLEHLFLQSGYRIREDLFRKLIALSYRESYFLTILMKQFDLAYDAVGTAKYKDENKVHNYSEKYEQFIFEHGIPLYLSANRAKAPFAQKFLEKLLYWIGRQPKITQQEKLIQFLNYTKTLFPTDTRYQHLVNEAHKKISLGRRCVIALSKIKALISGKTP